MNIFDSPEEKIQAGASARKAGGLWEWTLAFGSRKNNPKVLQDPFLLFFFSSSRPTYQLIPNAKLPKRSAC